MSLAQVNLKGPATTRTTMAEELRGLLSQDSVVREGELMARRTTLRVGGTADFWLEPADEADLARLLWFASERGLPVLLLGRGSNLLVRDGGLRGLVICLCQPHFTRVDVEGHQLRCGAGARLKAVAVEARKQGLAGLEFLEGIPGSVGGALRMNAGAHGQSVFEVVREVRMLDFQGVVRVSAGAGMDASYRSCSRLQNQVAVQAVFTGQPGDPAAIEQRMQQFNQKRWSSQPAAPSAGCIFKNPPLMPAGRLLEELGMKGLRVGGARVSQEHANFIVTETGASAAEVLELIGRIQHKVRNECGIELETEVQIVGEEKTNI